MLTKEQRDILIGAFTLQTVAFGLKLGLGITDLAACVRAVSDDLESHILENMGKLDGKEGN